MVLFSLLTATALVATAFGGPIILPPALDPCDEIIIEPPNTLFWPQEAADNSIKLALSRNEFLSRDDCVAAANAFISVDEGWTNDAVFHVCVYDENGGQLSATYILDVYSPFRASIMTQYELNSDGVFFDDYEIDVKRVFENYGLVDGCYINDDFFIEVNDIYGNFITRSKNVRIENPLSSVGKLVFLENEPQSADDCLVSDVSFAENNNRARMSFTNGILTSNYDTFYVCARYEWVLANSEITIEAKLVEEADVFGYDPELNEFVPIGGGEVVIPQYHDRKGGINLSGTNLMVDYHYVAISGEDLEELDINGNGHTDGYNGEVDTSLSTNFVIGNQLSSGSGVSFSATVNDENCRCEGISDSGEQCSDANGLMNEDIFLCGNQGTKYEGCDIGCVI